MSKIVRDGDTYWTVYTDEERRLAMRIAVIASWVLVVWLLLWFPMKVFVRFVVWGPIGLIPGLVALWGFGIAVQGRIRHDDED